MDKQHFDRIRNRGGMADIGTAAEGAIVEMYNLGGRMIIIKEKALYEFRLADDIDPGRQNPNLPSNMQRLLISQGSESETVSRTFLTAKLLFKKEYLPATVDTVRAIELSLEVLQEMVIMESEMNEIFQGSNRARDAWEMQRTSKTSFAIPSIPDLLTRCKTIFQKADHVCQALMEIVRLFYTLPKKDAYYTDLYTFLSDTLEKEHPFVKDLDNFLFFILTIRRIRNGLEHRRNELSIKNFELQVNGDLLAPSIALSEYQGGSLDPHDLVAFLQQTKENLKVIFEMMCTHLCATNTRPEVTKFTFVAYIPEDRRRNPYTSFAYYSPLGDTGWFYQ